MSTTLRRRRAWYAFFIGSALFLAPFAFRMFTRAPQGGVMISQFQVIMNQPKVQLFTAHYMPTTALGLGSLDSVGQSAFLHFDHLHRNINQVEAFYASKPNLAALSYVDQNFSNMAGPFTTMLTVMHNDLNDYLGLAGLPPFVLFPYFFLLPGLFIMIGSLLVLRRERDTNLSGKSAKAPAVFVVVIGLMVAAAPFLPMPPGLKPMTAVAPGGTTMLNDFAAPLQPGQPAIMSQHTVNEFRFDVAKIDATGKEIIPAIQDIALVKGHHISPAAALGWLKTDALTSSTGSSLLQFYNIYPQMVGQFDQMLTIMQANLGNYAAVAAMPTFQDFPYFFIIPGLLAALCGALMLKGMPKSVKKPKAKAAKKSKTPALAGA
jgi:hypothetical protein